MGSGFARSGLRGRLLPRVREILDGHDKSDDLLQRERGKKVVTYLTSFPCEFSANVSSHC
jgi:hypothetical protein